MNNAKIQYLTAKGGNIWKGIRIYFNDLHTFLGLDVSFYKTGNVSF